TFCARARSEVGLPVRKIAARRLCQSRRRLPRKLSRLADDGGVPSAGTGGPASLSCVSIGCVMDVFSAARPPPVALRSPLPPTPLPRGETIDQDNWNFVPTGTGFFVSTTICPSGARLSSNHTRGDGAGPRTT